jgi:hypothetical protein
VCWHEGGEWGKTCPVFWPISLSPRISLLEAFCGKPRERKLGRIAKKEVTMSLVTLVQKWLAQRSRPAAAGRRQRRFVPQIDGLEDRQLLSTILVVNTNDSGPGSLRQAILDSNVTPGSNSINFNIGTGARTINLQSALPEIKVSVVLNGTTQGGYAGKPLIELNGAGAGVDAIGLCILAKNTTVEGLAINRFSNAGIELLGTYDTVTGDYLGTDLTGTVARPNDEGVIVSGEYDTIGGTMAAARNVISGNLGDGVWLINGYWDEVMGNYIGVTASGSGALGNTNGVVTKVSDMGSVISGNVIGTNRASGVVLGGTTWGTEVDGNSIQQNGADGILVANSSLYLQLGASIIDDNTISSNSSYAVLVVGSENEIFSNSLSFNGINQVVAQPGTVNSIYGNTGIGSHLLGYGETFVVSNTTLNAL